VNSLRRLILNILLFSITMIFISCREEIIQPDNISGNINQPTQIKEFNFYTFIINADNANFTITEPTNFTFDIVNLLITNLDYAKGVVKLNILNDNGDSYFEYFVNEEIASRIISVQGFIPSLIEIQLIDFTGKFKVQLSPY